MMQTKWDSVHANHRQWIWQVGGWLHAASWTVLLPCAVVWCSGGLLFPVKWVLYHNLSQFCAWNVIQCHSINVNLSWSILVSAHFVRHVGYVGPGLGAILWPRPGTSIRCLLGICSSSSSWVPKPSSAAAAAWSSGGLGRIQLWGHSCAQLCAVQKPLLLLCPFCTPFYNHLFCPASLSFLDCQSPWLTQI